MISHLQQDTLTNIKNILQQHWHLSKIKPALEDTFQQNKILADD